MKCTSCGNAYADGAPFCPFCGATAPAPAPAAAAPEPEAVERTVAMDPAALGVDVSSPPPAEDRTVAMSPAELGVDVEVGADADEDEKTVAMSLPPDFFANLDAATEGTATPAPETPKRMETMLGHPGIASVDPLGATMEATALDRAAPAPQAPAPRAPAPQPVAPAAVAPQPMAPQPVQPSPMAATPIQSQPTVPAGMVPPPQAPGPASYPTAHGQPAAKTGGGGLKIALIAVGAIVGVGLVVGLLVLLLSGGGGGGDLMAMLPESVDAVGSFDADQLRSSWVYAELESEVKDLAESEGDLDDLKADYGVTIDTVASVGFGAQFGKKRPRFAAVIVGAFDREKAEATLEDDLAGGDEDRVHELGDHKFYGKKKREVAGFVADDTLVGGSYKLVKSMMKVQGGEKESAEKNAALGDALGKVDTGAMLWGAIELDEDMAAMASASGGGLTDGALGKGDVVAGSLSLDGDLVLKLAVLFDDEDSATKAKEAIDQGLEMADAQMEEGLPMPDEVKEHAKAVREGLAVELDGKTLTVEITVPKALLEVGLAMGKDQLPDLVKSL